MVVKTIAMSGSFWHTNKLLAVLYMLARKILLIAGFATLIATSILIERHYNRPMPVRNILNLPPQKTGIQQGYYYVEQPLAQPDFQTPSTTVSADIPTSSVSSSVRISYFEETKKRWIENARLSNPHVTTTNSTTKKYTNDTFGLSFSFPSELFISDHQDETWGTLSIFLENEHLFPHSIRIKVRDGDRFLKEQNKTELDISSYHFDYVFERYRNTIAQPWEPLESFEESVIINGRKFLKRHYFEPEFERFVRSYLTYIGNAEYDISLTYYENERLDFDRLSARLTEMDDDFRKGTVADEGIKKGAEFLEGIMRTIKINGVAEVF